MSIRILHGDCLVELPKLAAAGERFHAVVTDPPYGLEFMGREWDGADGFRRSLNAADAGRDSVFGRTSQRAPEFRAPPLFQQWCEAWARAVYDVLLPGAYLLAFGGTRTSHRLVCAIEDAGFEIRDTVAWLYGSGFPKSLDVSKTIDRMAGADREVVARGAPVKRMIPGSDQNVDGWIKDNGREFVPTETAPATDAARQWSGWGTALKPAFEPIVVARKPIDGTVAANVLKYGCGAINIDASRVEATDAQLAEKYASVRNAPPRDNAVYGKDMRDRGKGNLEPHSLGRFPANVVHDGSAEVTEAFATYGDKNGGHHPAARGRGGIATSGHAGQAGLIERTADTGSAARFFYTAKADAHDRQGSKHPTVKPTDLMRYLVRLVTPPADTVLDPFCGTGSTLLAADQLGFKAVGIEREAQYVADARRKFERDAGMFADFT